MFDIITDWPTPKQLLQMPRAMRHQWTALMTLQTAGILLCGMILFFG